MTTPHAQTNPDNVHRHQIDELATELACDEALVAEVYWSVVEGLERSSRLKEFLPVFAARKTRDRLKQLAGAAPKPH